MSNTDKFSVVLPVFNEQDNLQTLFSEIRAAADSTGRPWEAVFVDDCSTDNSLSIIRALADEYPEVRYVAFAENRGQSAAFCAGFDAVNSGIVVTMDSDLQNDPADIPGMLDVFGIDCEMVIGWRTKRKDTFIKRISSKIANKIRDSIMDDGVHDTGCSLKVMQTDLLRSLPRFRNMHRYFPILMKMHGARIREVKVNHRERGAGESKYGTLDRALAGIYDLIGVRWLMNRHFNYIVKEKK
ncbi:MULTISPECIES: glycosyltransferase family 2 protein [unclassified Pseudodesulfovibrio]|uniref:glycosyltransferase family 2 protein n=1 Tax=unclassified Pseudodesulfovibrio TaxID=2661612 RepID=UPI000FEBFE11|nr:MULTISPECIES: glycosyltransferase family 2 protein [unclassified Pseudodesulfovibrio]MCJ2164233.1 glycosyltransferase family 2 protein [Pseudodesulfovibrio sp. S3-i]RWU05143.1 glycosyltransferase [Pseudodesulfovibrio sp. S3]